MKYAVFSQQNCNRLKSCVVAFVVAPFSCASNEEVNRSAVASFPVNEPYQKDDARNYAYVFTDYLNKLEEVKDNAKEKIKLGTSYND